MEWIDKIYSMDDEKTFSGQKLTQLIKNDNTLSETEITELVDDLLDAQKITVYLEKLRFLNFTQASLKPEIEREQINEALMVFLKQFGVTVLLVIE